jgi:hypothetical protein
MILFLFFKTLLLEYTWQLVNPWLLISYFNNLLDTQYIYIYISIYIFSKFFLKIEFSMIKYDIVT